MRAVGISRIKTVLVYFRLHPHRVNLLVCNGTEVPSSDHRQEMSVLTDNTKDQSEFLNI
jgi:hypothetical protein